MASSFFNVSSQFVEQNPSTCIKRICMHSQDANVSGYLLREVRDRRDYSHVKEIYEEFKNKRAKTVEEQNTLRRAA